MPKFRTLDDIDVRGKRVLLRDRSPWSGGLPSRSVAGRRLECPWHDLYGRLAHADGRDARGEQPKYSECVEPTAKAAGGVFEPADDRGAGAAAQDTDRVDPGDPARQGRPGQEWQREQMRLRRVEADRGERQPHHGPIK